MISGKKSPNPSNSTKKVHVQHLNSSNSSRPVTPNSSRSNSSEQFIRSINNTGYDSWSKKELVNYYTLKVAEYETEVENQIELLKKRKLLLEETKSIKSELYNLIEKRDSLSEEASKIENEIDLLKSDI